MIEGKTVNIHKDRIGLLSFFYPEFVVRENIFFDNDNKVIYIGKDRRGLIGYLRENTKEFINTVGPYDYDLEDREVLIDMVYGKWGKEPKEDVKLVLNGIPDEEFYGFIKRRWVSARGEGIDSDGKTIYDLYKVFGRSKGEAVMVYTELLERFPPIMIESSLLTFIGKVVTLEDVEASGHYMKLLRDFKDRHGEKIKAVLYKYKTIDYGYVPNVLWLILQF